MVFWEAGLNHVELQGFFWPTLRTKTDKGASLVLFLYSHILTSGLYHSVGRKRQTTNPSKSIQSTKKRKKQECNNAHSRVNLHYWDQRMLNLERESIRDKCKGRQQACSLHWSPVNARLLILARPLEEKGVLSSPLWLNNLCNKADSPAVDTSI